MGIALAVLLFGFSAEMRGQVAVGNDSLVDLQQQFNLAYAKLIEPVTKLDISYARALKGLFDEETSAGRLDSALKVQTEIDGFNGGRMFDGAAFLKRSTEYRPLEDLRGKYLAARSQMLDASKDSRAAVLVHFESALRKLELSQTQSQELELAVSTRKVRDFIANDPRFQELKIGESATVPSMFAGRFHFVAKGEVEIRHNGDKVSYRNRAKNVDSRGNVRTDDAKNYIDGETRSRDIRVGDVLVIKMRSNVVYRSMIMAFQSNDKSIAIPFTAKDYRYLGEDVKEVDFDLEKLLAIDRFPDASGGDPSMVSTWADQEIADTTKAASEWIKIGASDKWHCYAVIIQPEMLMPK